MQIYSVIFVSAILLLTAAALLVSHVWAWRASQRQELDTGERDYRRRQFRRRMHTSATLGLLGVAVLIGYLLTLWFQASWLALVFSASVMVLLCWVVLLAAMDIWATKRHFGRLRQDCLVEQAKLEAQIRRIQAVRGNGKGETAARQPKSPRREDGVD
jgi:UDP-N-acetylmuramyl pentapeptide phosphotransferase/UDP-N-acetylglucosamine-1-phosphate transferase